MELLEGFDGLNDDLQEKVKRAIEQGHVDDDDWKGEPEQNRPGKRGKFAHTPRKQQAKPETDDGEPPGATPKVTKTRKKKAIKEEAPANGVDDALPTNPEPNNDGANAPSKPARTRKRKVKVEEVDPAYEPNEQPAEKRSKQAAAKKSAAGLESGQDNDFNPVATEAADHPGDDANPKKRGRRGKASNAVDAKDGAAMEKATGPIQEPGHADEEPGNADEQAPRKISKRAATLGQPTAASLRPRRGVKPAET